MLRYLQSQSFAREGQYQIGFYPLALIPRPCQLLFLIYGMN